MYFEIANNQSIAQLSILLIIVGIFIMIVGAVGAVGAIFGNTIFGRITLGLVSSVDFRAEWTMSTHEYPAKNTQLSFVSYRAMPCSNAPNHSIPVGLKIKIHGVTSILCTFEPSAPMYM